MADQRPPTEVPPGGPRRRLWPWLLGGAAALGITGGVAVVVVVVVLALLALAVLVAAVVGVFALVLVVTSPVSHGPEFVDALAADNDQAAYDLLCERTAAELSFEQFVAGVAPARPVVSVTQVTSGGGFLEPPTRVEATFVFDDGTQAVVTYEAEEGPDGNFYVCDPPPLQ